MKKSILYIVAGITLMIGGCKDPDDAQAAIERQPLTSIRATFAEGNYKDDTKAEFTASITDPSASDIVIEIPYYYPEESFNQPEITKMRLQAVLDNNCRIEPQLGVVDLTKENHYTLIDQNGERKPIVIRGEIYKLRKAQITFLTAENEAGDVLTGSIDDVTGTISLMTPDDLSAMKIEMTVSPHATFSPAIENKLFNLNDPLEITVTAHDGVTTKKYTVKKEIPNKVGYGYKTGSEKDLWSVNTSDLGLNWGVGTTTLAAIGNFLVVSNGDGTTPIYLNRMTGAKLGTINLGAASTNSIVANDEKENLLIVNSAASGQTLKVYRTKSVKTAPTLFMSYNNVTGLPISRVSVLGDIDNNAVIVGICDGLDGVTTSSSIVRWDIRGGVIGSPEIISFTGVGAWGAGIKNAKVTPLSLNKADGYILSYYDSGNIVYFVNGTTNEGRETVKDGSGTSWAQNLNRADVKVFNNARYMVLGSSSFFPDWGIKGIVYLFDVTTLSTLTGDVSNSTALSFTRPLGSYLSAGSGVSASGEVLLVPSSNGFNLHLYYWDNNNKIIGAYGFDCIDK